ncbi:MAG: polymorphic toxin-type HINT domain-containing protein [Planctomycetota bacterium]|nr:polymorphic toxin-type HINT domain-containing protein [Planctomycetota bacterium]
MTDRVCHWLCQCCFQRCSRATITSTPQHPIWLEEREAFVGANTIQPGEHTTGPSGERCKFVESRTEEFKQAHPVYNLTVGEAHTFFVTDADVTLVALVHNSDECVPGKSKSDNPKGEGVVLKGLDDVPWGKYCRTGCEDVAKNIQGAIGGKIHRIKPNASLPGRPRLGARGGQRTDWFYHEVVVKDGRVYDALTGPNGLPIDEFKRLWEYGDVIDFGF